MVHAPFYLGKNMENCSSFLAHKLMSGWLVVSSGKELVSIKRVTFTKKLSVRLNFTVPVAGRQSLKLFCFSDSYAGVDQEHGFEVVAGEAEEEEDSDAMEEDD